MNEDLRKRVMLASLAVAGVLFGLGDLGSSRVEAQTWKRNVPDSFQHQRWGARAGQAIPGAAGGVPGAADAAGDSSWECSGYVPGLCVAPAATRGTGCAVNADCDNPAGAGNGVCFPGICSAPAASAGDMCSTNANCDAPGGAGNGRCDPLDDALFGGICFHNTTVNLLYHFRQRGPRTFGRKCTAPAASVGRTCVDNADCDNPAGAGNGTCTTTDVANSDELHDQVKRFKSDYEAAAGATTSAKINKVLSDRKAGKDQGFDGLLAQNFKQVGNQVRYISSDGTQKNLGKGTLYEHVQAILKAGDMTNLRLAYPHNFADRVGTPQEGLWWAGTTVDGGNFHNVTVAGISASSLYFADPDSNPVGGNGNNGNRNVDGGWVTRPDGTIRRWKAAAAAAAVPGDVKPERFAAGAAVPIPAGAEPTDAERKRLYFRGKLAGDQKEFDIASEDFDRYDAVQIRFLETLETIKGVAKPGGGGTPGKGKGLSFSPGAESGDRITDLWVFPASADQTIVQAAFAYPGDANRWMIEIIPGPYMDLWGNQRANGALHVKTLSGSAGSLIDGAQLDLNYDSSSGQPLYAWDLVYDDTTDHAQTSLGVQCYGALCGYDLAAQESVPTAGACCAGNGSCSIMERIDCTGTFLGNGTPCNPDPCACDDGNPCTIDGGTPASGCTHTNEPNGFACDDGDLCTQTDACNQGVCVGSNPLVCSDGNLCTTDHCDPSVGCEFVPVVCNDVNDCTDETCVPGTGCVSTPDDSNLCSDGNPCTLDACNSGTCACPTSGPCQRDCQDTNPCTADSCDSMMGGCVHTPISGSCSDGSLCTTGDVCSNGACVGTPVNCDDGNVCTTDTCNPASGQCGHANNTDYCDDGDVCTQNDVCGPASGANECHGTTIPGCGSGAGPCEAVGLTVEKVFPSSLRISWTRGAHDSAVDYGIYQGSLGSWYSHGSIACSIAATNAVVPAAPGNRYYLVVPRNGAGEGTYGTQRNGAGGTAPRPPGVPACAAQAAAQGCFFEDDTDNGDDALHAGCHWSYPDPMCTLNRAFTGGDVCLNEAQINEWTDDECHPALPVDKVTHSCSKVCGGPGHCAPVMNACGPGLDSAQCLCP